MGLPIIKQCDITKLLEELVEHAGNFLPIGERITSENPKVTSGIGILMKLESTTEAEGGFSRGGFFMYRLLEIAAERESS